MRSPGHPALRCGIQEYPPLSYRTPMQHQVIPRSDAGSREYRLYTAGNRPGSRDARPVHPTSNLYPQRSMSSFPLFFSRKRKGEAKRKLPADVRKLKNGCAVRGERTRRARLESAIQSVIPLRAPRPIHPDSNIFSPHSSLSVIFLSAFSHRPDGCALRSCRALMRHPGIPTSLPVRFTFLDPASRCGVTRCASRVGRRHPLSYRALTRYPENPGEGPRFCMVGDMFYLIL